MRILIIGGTKFLGRHLIDSALKLGHEVTIFTRGREKTELSSDVEHLIGDRENNLEALLGRSWDRVIDTCGYTPWDVKKSTELLAGSAQHYTFVSSISVYSELGKPNINEETPVCTITNEELEAIKVSGTREVIMKYYGELKYLCEVEAKKAMPGRVLNVRPGLIVGKYDPTDRFTYWINRISRGGEILCPERKDNTVQFIHAGDLADWIIKACVKGIVGEYNATGPDYKLTMEGLLEKCKEVCNRKARLTWVSEDFLFKNNVKFWSDMPLWIPDRVDNPGFLSANLTKALKEGLVFRSLEKIILDTLNWDISRSTDYSLKAGISAEREKELLRLWNS